MGTLDLYNLRGNPADLNKAQNNILSSNRELRLLHQPATSAFLGSVAPEEDIQNDEDDDIDINEADWNTALFVPRWG